jgi:hypothetical protein
MLFCTKHNKRIGGVAGRPPVPIAGIARLTLRRTGWLAVDKELHCTIRSAQRDNVMPLVIVDAHIAAQRCATVSNRDAKNNQSVAERDAKVAKITLVVDVAVDDDIAVNPTIILIAARRAVVFARRRP